MGLLPLDEADENLILRRDGSVVEDCHGAPISDPSSSGSRLRSKSVSSNARLGSLTSLPALDALKYPIARRDDSAVDYYHGVCVPDPYRWLEDPDAEEVKEFEREQGKLTESVLKSCDTREKLREKITTLYDNTRCEAPFKRARHSNVRIPLSQAESFLFNSYNLSGRTGPVDILSQRGDKCFYLHNNGLQAQNVLYVQDSLNGKSEVLLDPNGLSEDGTISLNTIAISEDTKYLAYGLSSSGSDWVTIKVMRIEDKREEPDTLSWYVLLNILKSSELVNKVYYCDMSAFPKGLEGFRDGKDLLPFTKLVDKFDAQYQLVANNGTLFTFFTNKDAPKGKLICVDLKETSSWTDVLQEDEKYVLESAYAVNGDQMIVSYLSDAANVLQIRDLKTGSLLHHLPINVGTVYMISARRKDSVVFIGFTSFLTPWIIYQCNLDTEVPDLKIFHEISVPKIDLSEFQVDQVFVPSKDGTKIPMFIVSRKNILLDGSHPCLLYGYGGFNQSVKPEFRDSWTILARHLGAVFCTVNIRGGGEYGQEWHKAGSLAKKQNCFDDFISAAEYLISAGYTQPKKLCIEGESNGGLLVGACINQRPDLFGCALAHVGVMDMLRFHKFTIGHAWTSEYGCSDKEEEFHCLIKYSPLHNVRRPWEQHPDRPSQYPSTMLLTADHDDRVVPLHSLKLLATMQHVLCTSLEESPQTNPIIGRIECNAGHGAGRPRQKMIDEAADRYSFMAKMLGASWIE